MNNRLEIPVSLGLNEVIKQVKELRQLLADSVKPQSASFEPIEKQLKKIGEAASGLKGKLSTAFQTSRSSQTFLNQYEKLLAMLNSVKSSFTDLGLSEIKLTVDDSNKVEEYTKKIRALQEQIDAVSNNGKVGVLFNLDEFKTAKTLLEQIKIDPANFTASGLMNELQSEIDNTQGKIDDLNRDFQNADNILNKLGKGSLTNLNAELQKATENANGLVTKITNVGDRRAANNLVKSVLDDMTSAGVKPVKSADTYRVKEDTDITTFINDTTKNIKEAFEKRIEIMENLSQRVSEVQSKLLGQTTDKATISVVNSDEIRNLFKSLGIEKALDDELKNFATSSKTMGDAAIRTVASNLKTSLDTALGKIPQTPALEALRDSLIKKIEDIFDGIGTTFVSKAGDFKKSLQDIFAANDININGNGFEKIREIINNISQGDNVNQILSNLATEFQNLGQSLAKTDPDQAKKFTDLTATLTLLNATVKATDDALKDFGQTSNLDKKQGDIERFSDLIDQLMKKGKEGIKIPVDPNGNLEKGKSAIDSYINSLTKLENKQKALSNVQSAVTRWMGFYQVLNLTKRAINDMKQHIRELDDVMTKIAVVTNMTTSDLWNQISTYSEIARQYGVAIKGVYEVSQIYYQQGLNKGDVMGLTTETLKMARIAGIDYATAADYMTTAIRGFKLEMSEAAHVTDVFSALAASTASSTEELATAISKTASSAASVGASFEATSAMMATMIATTRESATNIGTALKSIISRYGELKENMNGTDAEGEEYSLNKVDKALQTVGISIHNAAGQFRDFDEVILELAQTWDTIDKNTQRYIATVMAGNRQQSRFLALVSNVEEYKRALEIANDAAGSGDIQTLKTLDSIDAKIERMKVTIQEFYTSSGLQDLYKSILDIITNIVSAANSLPKLFDKIPAMALIVGASIISIIKNIITLIISDIQTKLELMKTRTTNIFKQLTQQARSEGEQAGKAYSEGFNARAKNLGKNAFKNLASMAGQYLGSAIQLIGSGLTLNGLNKYGASLSPDEDKIAGQQTRVGAWAAIGGSALSGAAMGSMAGGFGALLGAVGGFFSGLITNIETLRASNEMLNVSLAREIELKRKAVSAAQTEETTSKGVTNNLQQAFDKLQQLKESAYDSSEAMNEYKEYMNQLADSYPYLINKIEITGDKTIELADLEEKLAASRVQSALATVNALKAEQEQKSLEVKSFSNLSKEVDAALNPEGAGLGSYSYQNLQTLMQRENVSARDPYAYYNYLIDTGKIAGTKIDVGSAYMRLGANESNLYRSQLSQAYQYLSSQSKVDYSNSYNTYINALKDIMASNPTLTLSDITGIDYINSLDQLKGLSTVDLIQAMQHTQERAQDYINTGVAEVHNLDNAIQDAELQLKIESNLQKNILTDTVKYQKYTSLISGLITTEHGINWAKETDSETVDEEINKWKEWIATYQESADWLMTSFDQMNYKSETDLRNVLEEKNLPVEVIDKYVENWKLTIEQLNSNLINILSAQIKDVSARRQISKAIYADGKMGASDGLLLNGQLVNILQNKLIKYKSLINQELTTAAQNYMNSISDTFEALANSLSSEQQVAISPIISNIDFMDIESIEAATDTLNELDPELYGDLIAALSDASARLAVNIEAQVIQLREKAKDISKNVEKVFDGLDKGIKLSEAIEQFDELAKNYGKEFNFKFDDIYKWDEALQGYVLQGQGIAVWIQNITNQYTDKINNLSQQLKETTAIYDDVFGNSIFTSAEIQDQRAAIRHSIRSSSEKYSAKDAEGNYLISDEELDAKVDSYMERYETLYNEFIAAQNAGETKSWEEWIKNKSQLLKDLEEEEKNFLENLPNTLLIQKLNGFDYKSITRGTAPESSRKTLEALLEQAGVSKDQLGDAFQSIWDDMLAGNFDSYNKLLSDSNINFQISDTKAFTALQEEYQQYSEGLSEILSSKPIVAWSDATKEIAGITTETDLDTVDIGTTALQFLQRIAELVGLGAATIEDQEQSILKVMDQNDKDAGIGKQKQFLDFFKDGFTKEELVKLGGIDENGNLKAELAGLVEKDKVTGDFKIIAEGTVETILQRLADALNITLDTASENYIDAVDQGINDAIAKADKNDTEKQIVATLQSIANASVRTRINANNLPQELKDILGVNINGIYTVTSELARDTALLAIDSTSVYNLQWRAQIRKLQDSIKSKRNKNSVASGIVSSTISQDAWKSYVQNFIYPDISVESFNDSQLQLMAYNRGYIWDEYTQSYRATIKSLEIINKDIEDAVASGTASPETIAALRKQAADLEQELIHDKKRDALANLLSNYQDAESFLSEFYAQFGEGYSKEELKQKGILTIDEHGKEVIDIDKLNDIVEGYDDLFKTIIEERIDEYISNAEKAGSLFTQGTTSQVEMSAFKEAYKKLTEGDVEFIFDPLLQAWTIDIIALKNYLSKAAATMGLDEEGQKSWIDNQMKTLLTDNLDFSEYLAGTNTKKENNILKKNLTDYFKTHNEDYMPYMGSLEEWAEQRTDNLLATLDKGGQETVDALKSVKGELTPEEIQNAYRAQVAPIKALYDQIDELQVGSVVAENQINALTKAGFTVNADGVVTVVGDLVEAYKSLYDQMKDTGEATLAEINEALGKYLDNRDGEQQAIDALSNAANMTYSQLAEIYTQAGIELTEELVDAMEEVGIIKGLGGNKLMIQDFRAFAKQMNWGEGSEEYINAFKAYNDSLIEYDRQTEKSIVEEIKNVAAAKPGDKINLTHFVSQLENGLDTILVATGATIQNGILTITEGADLADITNQLLTMVPESVELIPDEIAEIADAVNAILQQIASLIKEGINGTLSHANKQSLTSWGNANGLNLQFTQTAEGFKLAQESAIQVYYTLKNIDALQGKLVFDELNKSLQETNEHYKGISDIANRIAWIEDKAHPERAAQYAQELALAKEIYAVRSTTEDSSFSFMSNKIPGAQNNPINYFNNWAQAIHTFNDALKTQGTYTKGGETYKSGFVDYDFWYNLVTEMNNIAALGGDIKFAGETLDGSLEAASKLIQKGAESLVVTDTGEVKVALKGMSLDFATGADAFSGNVTEGIQALAKSQSKMLGGLIKLLEAVVAMEKLGDITGGDNKIDIGDLFPKFDAKGGKQKLNEIEGLDAFIKQAGDSLDSIIINNETLTQMIARARDEGLDKAEAENFTAIMNSLYQMYKSGDYNLENLYDSIQQIMAQSKFTGELQLGDTILHVKNGAIIIETEDKEGKKKFQTPNGETYDTMGEAIARSAVMAQGIKEGITFGKDEKLEQEVAAGTLTIKTLGVDVEVKSDKQGNLTFNGASFDNIDQYIQNLIDEKKLEDTEAAQLKTNVGLEIGTIKLDSFSYKSIDSKIREEFEAKLASGSQVEVDKYISLHPVLKQLEGKTGAEITEMLHLDDVKVIVDNSQATEAIDAVTKALDAIDGRVAITTIVTYKKTVEEGTPAGTTSSGSPSAKKPNFKTNYVVNARGNVGTANAKGTLMGELGPELVVSNGRYFVAGQNGAEFVNLDTDAIVFNHLQTKSLLEKGMSSSRGKAVTNERNAVSFATGNINGGPAKASPSAALETLKQLKAQWDALAGLSVRDLARKGGSGGGGGKDIGTFVKELEKWYNWLQRIAQLEKEINLEESKRSKYQSSMIAQGREYAASQYDTLGKLKEQAATQLSLNNAQGAYFEQRRQELNENSAFKALYEFDSDGQLKYKDGQLEWLSKLSGRDSVTGQANYTAKEQYDALVNAGYGDQMKYDSTGAEINQEEEGWEIKAVQAFWDKIEAEQSEMQSLHDDVMDGENKLYELQTQQNQILKEIEDNQIAVEDKVLGAITDLRQREIDEMQKERDAIEESSKNLIDGLSNQLQKERDMYSRQKDANELSKLQRQLAILQRSGGSASQIATLQNQITDQMQESYFDAQQAQIDALQESSDNQLERLDRQIDLMTEQLTYEKENGLLWNQVYDVMSGSPEEIATFIHQNTSSYWAESPMKSEQSYRDTLFEAQRFVEFRDDIKKGLDTLIEENSDEAVKNMADEITAAGEEKAANSGSAGEINTKAASSAAETSAATKKEEEKKDNPPKTESKKTYKVFDEKGYETNYTITAKDEKTAKEELKKTYGSYYTLGGVATKEEIATKETARKKIEEQYKYKFRGQTYNTLKQAEGAKDQAIKAAEDAYNAIVVTGKDSADKKQEALKALERVKTETILTLPTKEFGGMVEKTGIELLHAKEGVLTAEQTSILRNDILGSKPNSLLNLLIDFRDAYDSIPSASAYDAINSSGGLVIENATVEMNVSKIANDYDAQRAGEQALDKMLQIARKTQAQNRVGR